MTSCVFDVPFHCNSILTNTFIKMLLVSIENKLSPHIKTKMCLPFYCQAIEFYVQTFYYFQWSLRMFRI